MFRKLSTYVLFLLLGTPLAVMAQGTGTLDGRVLDGTTGEGLPGANVVIEGTQLGAATDLDGNYRIIGIPVGTYNVTARFVGFTPQTQEGVQINSGYTRQLDFSLTAGVELDEVVVEYERPLIQRDAIGAPRVVSGEDIQNLPVRGVANVAAIQGGVISDDASSALFIRGGREQEVQYYVDGVKVSGPVAVNQSAVQEQEMLIGTIPARYGDVQSGVISITTKTGRDRFFGSAEIITSEGLDAFGYNLAALSIGGPIIPGVASFFVSGEGNFQADASPYGVDTYRLTDEAFNDLLATPQVLQFVNEEGDFQYVDFPWEQVANLFEGGDGTPVTDEQVLDLLGDQAPEGFTLNRLIATPESFTEDTPGLELERGKRNPVDNITLNGNLNFNFSSALSLRLGGTYDTFDRETFTFGNSLYNRDRFYVDNQEAWRVFGTFRQRISNNAFYQIQADFQDTKFNRHPNGFSDDIGDVLLYGDIDNEYGALARRYFVYNAETGNFTRQFTNDGGSRPSSVAGGTFALPGAPLTNFQQSHNQQLRFSGSATTQLGVHQVEFGGEYEQQTRRFFSIGGGSVARYHCDEAQAEDCGAEQQPGVTRYEDLPFNALNATGYTYYGYNYLGTEEVDDQNIDAWFNYDADSSPDADLNVAPYKPVYYAGYIQDKVEFRDLVINVGLRVDVFDNNTTTLLDTYAPVPIIRVGDLEAGSAPGAAESDWAVYFNDDNAVVGFRDLDGTFYDTEGIETTRDLITGALSGQVTPTDEPISAAFTDYDPQVTVMPRVGVSFPVTDRALFFASYNVTSQRPTEQAFAPFTFFNQLDGQQSRVPNPSLKPERTTQYELGFRQRLGERAALTLSGFYRTQENKISNRPVFGGFPQYGSYFNQDFTTTKGMEVGFDLRRVNNLAVSANYTLSFAQGTGSDAGATAVAVWRGSFFPNFISPADFDQRHTANISVDYRFGQGEGPMIGGAHVLENFGINILGQFASGQHYTPVEAAGFSVNESFTANVAGSLNNATLPATSRLDLKVDRSFNLGFGNSQLKAYVWVQNLLDTRNVLAVYRATGLPDADGYLESPGGRSFLASSPDPAGTAFNYGAYTSGPVNVGGNQSSSAGLFYGMPRRVRIGLLFDF